MNVSWNSIMPNKYCTQVLIRRLIVLSYLNVRQQTWPIKILLSLWMLIIGYEFRKRLNCLSDSLHILLTLWFVAKLKCMLRYYLICLLLLDYLQQTRGLIKLCYFQIIYSLELFENFIFWNFINLCQLNVSTLRSRVSVVHKIEAELTPNMYYQLQLV